MLQALAIISDELTASDVHKQHFAHAEFVTIRTNKDREVLWLRLGDLSALKPLVIFVDLNSHPNNLPLTIRHIRQALANTDHVDITVIAHSPAVFDDSYDRNPGDVFYFPRVGFVNQSGVFWVTQGAFDRACDIWLKDGEYTLGMVADTGGLDPDGYERESPFHG